MPLLFDNTSPDMRFLDTRFERNTWPLKHRASLEELDFPKISSRVSIRVCEIGRKIVFFENSLLYVIPPVSFSLYFRNVSIDGDTYMCTAFLQVKIFYLTFFFIVFQRYLN